MNAAETQYKNHFSHTKTLAARQNKEQLIAEGLTIIFTIIPFISVTVDQNWKIKVEIEIIISMLDSQIKEF